LDTERYAGGLADWLEGQWLPAVRPAIAASGEIASAEVLVATALSGPSPTPLQRVQWEGLDYVVDVAATSRQRLMEVRRRQGGVTLDTVLALHEIVRALTAPGVPGARGAAPGLALEALASPLRSLIVAEEYENAGVDVQALLNRSIRELSLGNSSGVSGDLVRVVDFVLAHVLTSWAYAPHLGGGGSGALVGGDGSLRHRLGLRLTGRRRIDQPWEPAMSPAARGSIAGSILGVQAALASWSLQRLSGNAVPPAPAIDGNDSIPLMLAAALSNPRRLSDSDLADLAATQATGAELVSGARTRGGDLDALARRASLSPWRRAILPWMVHEEPERIDEQFSPIELARLGGVNAGALAAWGSVSMMAGSLRLALPPPRIPELFAGRTGDGIVGGRNVDLMLRVAVHLAELKLPATLAAPVLAFAMRDYLDRVRPIHAADVTAFARQARALGRREVEDYVGAIAAIGPLRPVAARP
jgi:hypothetical protein